MRLGELLDHLARYNPDDIIGIAIWGGKDYETTAIDQILHGQGIALLATPQRDTYRAQAREAAG